MNSFEFNELEIAYYTLSLPKIKINSPVSRVSIENDMNMLAFSIKRLLNEDYNYPFIKSKEKYIEFIEEFNKFLQRQFTFDFCTHSFREVNVQSNLIRDFYKLGNKLKGLIDGNSNLDNSCSETNNNNKSYNYNTQSLYYSVLNNSCALNTPTGNLLCKNNTLHKDFNCQLVNSALPNKPINNNNNAIDNTNINDNVTHNKIKNNANLSLTERGNNNESLNPLPSTSTYSIGNLVTNSIMHNNSNNHLAYGLSLYNEPSTQDYSSESNKSNKMKDMKKGNQKNSNNNKEEENNKSQKSENSKQDKNLTSTINKYNNSSNKINIKSKNLINNTPINNKSNNLNFNNNNNRKEINTKSNNITPNSNNSKTINKNVENFYSANSNMFTNIKESATNDLQLKDFCNPSSITLLSFNNKLTRNDSNWSKGSLFSNNRIKNNDIAFKRNTSQVSFINNINYSNSHNLNQYLNCIKNNNTNYSDNYANNNNKNVNNYNMCLQRGTSNLFNRTSLKDDSSSSN